MKFGTILISDEQLVGRALKQIISKHKWSRIVTHNLCGEYGHSQHKSLSKILHEHKFGNLYVFDKGNEILPFHLLQKKLNLLSIYKSQMFVIEKLLPYILYEAIVPFFKSNCFKKENTHENRTSSA